MNRLGQEISPYLLSHAADPVHWWPWCEEAFATAAALGRPVMVSIGYSSCHWCHVMARETFSDPAIAACLNEHFVSVKVDREERPDVDAVYVAAVQAMAGEAGWPTTVFCTSDGAPFYGGTYFPARPGLGKPTFARAMASVKEAWQHRRAEVESEGVAVVEALMERSGAADRVASLTGGDATEQVTLLRTALERLENGFDGRWGGFGRPPKFARPALLEFLLSVAAAPGVGLARKARSSADMATLTLAGIAAGGIRDHLGGGFARYATDNRWLVPHFEKIAPDQAMLARAYVRAWWITGEGSWRDVADETLAYVMAELCGPDGEVYSSHDAESEGEEGRYYLWRRSEMVRLLGRHAGAEAASHWGVGRRSRLKGGNVLHRPWQGMGRDDARPDVARLLTTAAWIESSRARLLAARRERPGPPVDDKVVTEWNAMMISTLCEAGMAMSDQAWIEAAERTATFLWTRLRDADGRWWRCWRNGQARHLAGLGDYAWLTEALIRLGEASGKAIWTTRAREVADAMLKLFWDDEHGGLYGSGADAEHLVVPTKEYADGAHPSANSVAAIALWRLAALTCDRRYDEACETIANHFEHVIAVSPPAAGGAMSVLHLRLADPVQVVIVGDRPDLVREAHRRYVPSMVLAWGEPYGSPLWEGRRPGGAYVCKGGICFPPATTVAQLSALICPDASPTGTALDRGRGGGGCSDDDGSFHDPGDVWTARS